MMYILFLSLFAIFGGICLLGYGLQEKNEKMVISGILISIGMFIFMFIGCSGDLSPDENLVGKIIGCSISIFGILILVIHKISIKIMLFLGVAILIGSCVFISSKVQKIFETPRGGDGINSCENCGREGVSLEPETGFCYDCYQGFTEWRRKEATKEYQDHGEWWK